MLINILFSSHVGVRDGLWDECGGSQGHWWSTLQLISLFLEPISFTSYTFNFPWLSALRVQHEKCDSGCPEILPISTSCRRHILYGSQGHPKIKMVAWGVGGASDALQLFMLFVWILGIGWRHRSFTILSVFQRNSLQLFPAEIPTFYENWKKTQKENGGHLDFHPAFLESDIIKVIVSSE